MICFQCVPISMVVWYEMVIKYFLNRSIVSRMELFEVREKERSSQVGMKFHWPIVPIHDVSSTLFNFK